MASKKGIAITAIILAAITGASFLLWVIPQENETTFVVTDYQGYLEGVRNIHEVLQESVDIEYKNLQEGKISPEEYITVTEVTSSQVRTQISEFITSQPSEQWQESYISYMNGMKEFNKYILETQVLANQIQNESPEDELLETIDRIKTIKTESIEHIKKHRPKILVEIEARHIGKEQVMETIHYLESLGYQGKIIQGTHFIPSAEFTFEKFQDFNNKATYANNFIFE